VEDAMSEQWDRWVWGATLYSWAEVLIGLAIVLLLARLARHLIARRVADTAIRYRARKLVTFFAYLVALAIVAVVFSSRLGQMAVAFGVIGAGIAFALQEVIASVAGWVAVSFGRFFSPGDRIQLGGITGDVIDIGILRTTLMECGEWVKSDLYNGRIVRVANSFVFKEPVFNYSADFPFLWDEIILRVRYGSDWEHARDVLRRIVDEVCGDYAVQSRGAWAEAVMKYRLEEAHIEPMVTLVATDNWLEFTARYVVDYRKRRATKDQLYTRILQEVDKSGGRIRLASTTVELVNLPHLDVAYADGKGTLDPRYVP
jgi:small-conductance mechanosensitive channel